MTAQQLQDRWAARAYGYCGPGAGIDAAAEAWRAGEPERERVRKKQAREAVAAMKVIFARQYQADARARGRDDAKAGRPCDPRWIVGPGTKALREIYCDAYAKALARKAD